jgi:predicted short-subunit dehydrogenase-like oxidoreductase (DUF2520 family)
VSEQVIRVPGPFSVVGPGRAGGSIALALVERGFPCVAVAGRAPDAEHVVGLAARLGASRRRVEDAGAGASVVLVATPDAAISEVAAVLAPGLEPGSLVLHLSGACTLSELDKLALARPDVRLGSLHPLQSLPSIDLGATRLAGSWCAVAGPPDVERLALTLGMRSFRVSDEQRARYHAAATTASNHLVALLGRLEALAAGAGVPVAAFWPLVRSTLDNVEALGAARALTGPVARGDVDTVRAHLQTLDGDERAFYRRLAAAALALSGRDDPALAALLMDVS